MAVKEYKKNTSYIVDETECESVPIDSEEASETGVENGCGCIPGIPNFINDFTIVTSVNGMAGDVVLDGYSTYIHEQMVSSSTWTITHNLGRYPSVTVVDSAGSVVVGDVTYVNKNRIILTFQGAFSGTAYLN